jgi:hypothetical protein
MKNCPTGRQETKMVRIYGEGGRASRRVQKRMPPHRLRGRWRGVATKWLQGFPSAAALLDGALARPANSSSRQVLTWGGSLLPRRLQIKGYCAL